MGDDDRICGWSTPRAAVWIACGVALLMPQDGPSQELAGQVAVETRAFVEASLSDEQPRMAVSFLFQPEWYWEWSDHSSLLITPYARFAPDDSARTHADIRELQWQYVADRWRLRAGIGRVFWGVTESEHLVDIINQTDLVENLDFEDKLGQPMVNLTLIGRLGTVDLFVLPGFRKRTFPGPKSRPGFPLRVATELTQFESRSRERHVDFAARWADTLGSVDLGIASFRGTSREPRLFVGLDDDGQQVLVPYYDQIAQTSLDLSWVTGDWLLKLEALNRVGQGPRFAALVGGFEYTLYGVFQSSADLGLLAEYQWDERGQRALTPFDNDVFGATRLSFNDVQGTELLSGLLIDRGTGATALSVEGSRRLGERWRVYLEVRGFLAIPESDFLYGFRADHYLSVEVARFF